MTQIALPTTGVEVARRRASYEEYLETASESRIVEWVDGEIIEYMPLSVHHQKITWFLFKQLSGFAPNTAATMAIIRNVADHLSIRK